MKHLGRLFKTLGDETRLRIIALLIDGQDLCVCDIVEGLALPQSTVSRHLSLLRNAGLVNDRRQGVWMYYRLNREGLGHVGPLHNLLALFFADLDQVHRDRKRLRKYLAAKKPEACS